MQVVDEVLQYLSWLEKRLGLDYRVASHMTKQGNLELGFKCDFILNFFIVWSTFKGPNL